jgi:hypothetical protein
MTNIRDALQLLIGIRAWGLTRTYGSAFILEFGEEMERANSSKIHGESHVLVQSGAWRISNHKGVFVGSDDDATFIDKQFSEFGYGVIESAIFNPVTFDLEFLIDNDAIIQVFVMSGNLSEDSWVFYQGASAAWAVEAGPKLTFEGVR